MFPLVCHCRHLSTTARPGRATTGDDGPVSDPSNAADGGPRRDTLADIFGEVLPETTSDEREPGHDGFVKDAWYHENRPPHHDR
jgi:hypothetical protein